MFFKDEIHVPSLALHKSDDKSGTRIYFGFIFLEFYWGGGILLALIV